MVKGEVGELRDSSGSVCVALVALSCDCNRTRTRRRTHNPGDDDDGIRFLSVVSFRTTNFQAFKILFGSNVVT